MRDVSEGQRDAVAESIMEEFASNLMMSIIERERPEQMHYRADMEYLADMLVEFGKEWRLRASGQGLRELGVERLTHGRHCQCAACAREDWTNPNFTCGMHGAACPRRYQPCGLAGAYALIVEARSDA